MIYHRIRIVSQLLSTVLLLIFATAAAAQGVTLQLATYGTLAQPWLDIAAAFNATHPDIQLEVQVYPFNDYIDKIMVMVATDTAPNLVQTWAQYKPQWVGQGMLEDLTQRWNASQVISSTRIYPFMVDAASYQGRIYGVPFDYNSTVYIVNRDLLDNAGVPRPKENWTVKDLRSTSRKIANEQWGTYGVNHGVDFGWGFNIQWYKNWMGHGWINQAEDTVIVDSPAAIDMFQWWYDNQYHYGITPRPGSYASRGSGYTQGWMNVVFNYPNPPNFDWEFALYPAGPAHQGNFAQGHMFSIPRNSANKDAAWQVLEWMASYEGQQTMVKVLKKQPIGPYNDLWTLFFNQLPANKATEIRNWVLNVLYGKNYVDNLSYWTTFPEMNDIMREHMGRIYGLGRPISAEIQEAARRMQVVVDTKK